MQNSIPEYKHLITLNKSDSEQKLIILKPYETHEDFILTKYFYFYDPHSTGLADGDMLQGSDGSKYQINLEGAPDLIKDGIPSTMQALTGVEADNDIIGYVASDGNIYQQPLIIAKL